MANVSVASTLSNISVNTTTDVVTVTATPLNLIVSETSAISNTSVWQALIVDDTGGDGSLSFSNTTGVFTYTGPNQTEANARIAAAPSQVRAHLSNTAPITYDSATGVIGLDQQLDDLTLVKYQETIVNNGIVTGAITADISAGTVHKFTLSGDITGITLSNIDAGGSASLFLTQDGIGGNQLDTTTTPANWTNWEFTNNFTTLDTTPSNFNLLNVFYDGTTYFASLVGETQPLIENSELANSAITINGIVMPLGSSANIIIDTFNTDVTVNANLLVNGSANVTGNVGFEEWLYIDYIQPLSSQPFKGYVTTMGNTQISTVNTNGIYATGIGNIRIDFGRHPSYSANLSIGSTRVDADGTGFRKVADFGSTGEILFDVEPLNQTVGSLDRGFKIVKGNSSQTLFEVNGYTGDITFNDAFTFPQSDGTSGQVLKTNGSGTVTWQDPISNSDIVAYIATVPLTVGGNLQVNGNINATGNINYQNVTDLYVTDQKITLNANAITNSDVEIIANRPGGNNTKLRWNESTDRWQFTNDGLNYYNMPTSTDDISEGATNLYFSGKTTDDLLQGSTNLYYDSTLFNNDFATKTTDNLTQGSTNLYYSDSLVDARLLSNQSAQFNDVDVFDLGIKDGPAGNRVYAFGANIASANNMLVYDGTQFKPQTANTSIIAEGTNLYYTDARVEAYLSGNTSTINADTIQANAFIGGTFTGDGSDLTDVRANTIERTVKNVSGVAIDKGYPLHVTGSTGLGTPEVVLADASNTALMPAHFIAGENIAIDAEGRGILSGFIGGIDTSAFQEGETIYVAPGGGYANVAPSGEGNIIQNLGIVTRSDASNGGGEVYGAGRGAATPNLDDGAIFVGSSANKSIAVDTTNNFDVSDTEFDLANALTNINSITTENGSDLTLNSESKLVLTQQMNGSETVTQTGNIVGDGYAVILDGSHSYTTGNISQQGTNNLNAYAVSGSATSGSNVFSITGVTHLKNVFDGSGSIDGTNNNVSLTGDMVANMIFDNWNGVDGDQYPYPRGTRLVSANTSALVFSESALANQTFSNAEPVAIVHGGYDSTTGQIISFVSQDDALADGSQTLDILGAPFYGGWNNLFDYVTYAGYTLQGNETVDTLIFTLDTATLIPQGTAVTPAGVTGPGSANINGQTFYIGYNIFNNNDTYSLFTDASLTTQANSQTIGINVTFDPATGTEGGNITYSVAQSTSAISKSRLYVQGAYGFGKNGPTQNDFTYTVGSASDYTIDLSAATTSMRQRTALQIDRGVLKAPNGLVIGENTEISNRGEKDSFNNFGLNMMWDGLTDLGSQYAGTSGVIPQILFKSYTDNTSGAGGGDGRTGPRLLFSSATGNSNNSEFEIYPLQNQELGRITYWGTTQTVGSGMSTVNPAGFISATAAADWTNNNKLNMAFAANANGYNNPDVYLAFQNGKLVLASADTSDAPGIHLAPAVTCNGDASQTYATLGHTWANVNYANTTARTGSKFTVTQGSAGSTSDGDLMLSWDREFIAGSTTLDIFDAANAGWLTEDDIFTNGNTQVVVVCESSSADIVDGAAVTFSGVLGPGNANINGNTFYISAGSSFDSGGANPDSFSLYHDQALSNNVVKADLGISVTFDNATGTGDGVANIATTGTSAKEWTITLDQGADDLTLKSETTTKVTFSDSATTFTNIPVMPSHSNTALPTSIAGGMIYVTNGNNKPAYGDGTNWYYMDNTQVT